MCVQGITMNVYYMHPPIATSRTFPKNSSNFVFSLVGKARVVTIAHSHSPYEFLKHTLGQSANIEVSNLLTQDCMLHFAYGKAYSFCSIILAKYI